MHQLKRSILLVLFLSGLAACDQGQDQGVQQEEFTVADALGSATLEERNGYLQALEVPDLQFPRDHNAHPGYRNEWWYFTGNLADREGREFGYQFTLFRTALAPPPNNNTGQRASSWATNQAWMGHAAITDRQGNTHHHQERFARGAAGLSGNTPHPFRVWLEDWQIIADGPDFPWMVTVPGSEFGMELQVTPGRDITLQGNRGLSQKGSAPGNASNYYSITRLATTGVLHLQGSTFEVSGLSWLDREWSTSALDASQVGWDWFSLQLDSGADLMYYQLRRQDGSADPLSSGNWLDGEGRQQKIVPDGVQLKPLRWWNSESGRRYPVSWRMKLNDPARDWLIVATLEDQLMSTLVEYWEGSVDVLDPETGVRLGRGYLEMTGY